QRCKRSVFNRLPDEGVQPLSEPSFIGALALPDDKDLPTPDDQGVFRSPVTQDVSDELLRPVSPFGAGAWNPCLGTSGVKVPEATVDEDALLRTPKDAIRASGQARIVRFEAPKPEPKERPADLPLGLGAFASSPGECPPHPCPPHAATLRSLVS